MNSIYVVLPNQPVLIGAMVFMGLIFGVRMIRWVLKIIS
jgi:hypothetical protein